MPKRRKLAILGGSPLFAEKLHVGRPNIGDRAALLERINQMLDRRWLTNDGPLVKELEQTICQIVGTAHCVAMCNATVALEIATRAAGMSGEVIVPSYTFVATAHCLSWQKITTVFADIDPESQNLDPQQVEPLVTERTSGILATHVWGRPAAINDLHSIAKRHGLKLIFDAAHALGCSFDGQMIGQFGDAEVFSFHATKFINSCEGGAVVTNDDDLAARMRLMRNFGFLDLDRVEHVGTNGKMSEICAAMGLTSLDQMNATVTANLERYEIYKRELQDITGLRLIAYDQTERNNFQYIVVDVDESQTRLARDVLVQVLHAERVLARRYFYPGCHRLEPYRTMFPQVGDRLPITERVASRVMVLPTGTAVNEDDIVNICSILRTAIQCAVQIRDKLGL